MFEPMFHLGVPILEKVLRPIVVYLFLVILLRVFGKRELAQLNPFDLIVLLSLSNTLQNAMIGDDNSVTGGLIGAFSLCSINYVVVRFLFKHHRLDQWIEGRPAVFIEGGKLRPETLAKELVSRAELLTIVHRQGFSSLEEIESCVLETGGSFTIKPRLPRQDTRDQAEILSRLDDLARQFDDLKNNLRPREPDALGPRGLIDASGEVGDEMASGSDRRRDRGPDSGLATEEGGALGRDPR